MRVLHYTTLDFSPGAAKSVYNIHTTLRNSGIDSHMIVRDRITDDETVMKAPRRWQSRVTKAYEYYLYNYSKYTNAKYSYNFNHGSLLRFDSLTPFPRGSVDAVFMHWVRGFLSTSAMDRVFDYYRCPIVWVMMDMEPLTGGCHQSLGCMNYCQKCGKCHVLNSERANDISRRIWTRKKALYSKNRITFVAPTLGLMEQAGMSSLCRESSIQHIPLPVEESAYRPLPMSVARTVLGISEEKKVICFGANETRSPVKGFGYLKTALERLSQLLLTDPSCGTASSEVLLLCAGGDFRHITRDLPFEVRYLGHVKDTVTMALMFQASDVFACPSVYDAGPVMIPESMMCGTPVVAFKAGGAADLLSNMETGYMAEYMNADDFAHGLYSILTGKDALRIRSNARKAAAERNSSGAVLKRYLDLLGSLTDVVPGAGAPSLPRIARS